MIQRKYIVFNSLNLQTESTLVTWWYFSAMLNSNPHYIFSYGEFGDMYYFFCWLVTWRCHQIVTPWWLNHFIVITHYQQLPKSYFNIIYSIYTPIADTLPQSEAEGDQIWIQPQIRARPRATQQGRAKSRRHITSPLVPTQKEIPEEGRQQKKIPTVSQKKE